MKQKNKERSKKITLGFCIVWLLILSFYASSIIGTLAHELMHKRNSIYTKAIEVNYDGSGITKGAFFRHSHEWVYLNGYIVEMFLFSISVFSVIVILFNGMEAKA